jgi:hypothetical protein
MGQGTWGGNAWWKWVRFAGDQGFVFWVRGSVKAGNLLRYGWVGESGAFLPPFVANWAKGSSEPYTVSIHFRLSFVRVKIQKNSGVSLCSRSLDLDGFSMGEF